jgi:hypothetical protein
MGWSGDVGPVSGMWYVVKRYSVFGDRYSVIGIRFILDTVIRFQLLILQPATDY